MEHALIVQKWSLKKTQQPANLQNILAVHEIRRIGQSILEKKECTVHYNCH
jgi:hypothetical protein